MHFVINRALIVCVYLAFIPSVSFADLIKTAPAKGFYTTTFQSNNPEEVVAHACPEHGGVVENVTSEVSMSFQCYRQAANGDLYVTNDWRDIRSRQYAEVCEQGWGEQYINDADGQRTNKIEYCWKADTSHVPGQPDMCSATTGKPVTHGNPIMVTSRRKVQRELDYLGAGNYPLKFERTYSSGRNGVSGTIPTRSEYKTWRHNYDKSLAGDLQPGEPEASSTTIWINGRATPALIPSGGEPGGDFNALRSDGSIIRIVDFASAANRKTTLTPSTTPQGLQGFRLTLPNDEKEFYDTEGRLVATQSRAGETHYLSYLEGKLVRVEDEYGKTLTFEYDGEALAALIDPAGNRITYQYNEYGDSTSVTYPDSNAGTVTREYLYDSLPRYLTGLRDERGIVYANWAYEESGGEIGLAKESVHANGVDRSQINGSNNSIQTIDAQGLVKNYQYFIQDGTRLCSSIERVASDTVPAATEHRSYNDNGFLIEKIDWNGNVTRYERDARGLPTLIIQAADTPEERQIGKTWHTSLRLPLQEIFPTYTVDYQYDAGGNPLNITVTDTTTGLTRTWAYTYDQFGKRLTEDGPRTDVSDVTTYTYHDCDTGNQCGQLATVTNALGHITSYTAYNAHGQPTSITDPNGIITTVTYDVRLRPVGYLRDGVGSSIEYSATGNVLRVLEADGAELNYTWDAANRLIGVADGQGNSITWTLDNAGNRIAEKLSDPSNTLRRSQSRTFDHLSRLSTVVFAHGGVNEYSYDANGNEVRMEDASNRATTQSYDALDRLVTSIDPIGGETDYGHNSLDDITSVTDPEGVVTTYQYNGFGDVLQENSQDAGVSTYTYDSAANMITRTDARNITTSYAYDALNRLTSVTYPNSAENISYTYDQGVNATGRLSSVADSQSGVAYEYDARGNIIQTTYTIGASSYNVSYAYNAANRMTGMTLPSGRELSYVYDASGRINTVSATSSGVSEVLASNIVRLPFGPTESFTLGNGILRSKTYDQDYRVSNIVDGAVLTRNYAWNGVNNITAITDSVDANRTQIFSYDDLDRLTFATGSYGDQSFTYDGVGNRLALEADTGANNSTQSYQYEANSHRLSAIVGERNFTYDAVGNTLNNGNASFTYNDRNRMNSATANGVTTSYEINPLGQRVRKSSTIGETQFIYDLSGRLIAEADASGAVLVEYAYLDGEPLAMWRDDAEEPEPTADYEFSSNGSTTQGKWQVFQFDVNAGELVEAQVIWDDPTADVRIFLRDESGTQIANDTDGGLPAMVSTTAQTSGTWSIGVSIKSGTVSYDVLVNSTNEDTPPEPTADFEFSSSGSTTQGKWQVFQFDVNAGELVEAQVIWDDPTADVRIFLRDENGTQIANDTDGGLPAMVSTTAATSGTWSIGVSIKSGTVNYDVLVNTTADDTPPEPAADFEFASSGSTTQGKWQVFQFDVNAGDLIEGEVTWDDPTADVRIFLRDENNTQVDNDTDGGLPALVSATATTSGIWSIGVSIKSGTVNYDVLVNADGGQ